MVRRVSASPKSHLSETDTCDRFITRALEQAGWTLEQHILREYTLRRGRVVVRGQASHRDKASMHPLVEQSRIVTRVTALRRLCADLRQRLAERQSVQARLAEALLIH